MPHENESSYLSFWSDLPTPCDIFSRFIAILKLETVRILCFTADMHLLMSWICDHALIHKGVYLTLKPGRTALYSMNLDYLILEPGKIHTQANFSRSTQFVIVENRERITLGKHIWHQNRWKLSASAIFIYNIVKHTEFRWHKRLVKSLHQIYMGWPQICCRGTLLYSFRFVSSCLL